LRCAFSVLPVVDSAIREANFLSKLFLRQIETASEFLYQRGWMRPTLFQFATIPSHVKQYSIIHGVLLRRERHPISADKEPQSTTWHCSVPARWGFMKIDNIEKAPLEHEVGAKENNPLPGLSENESRNHGRSSEGHCVGHWFFPHHRGYNHDADR
jgi:hypothetical protein